MSDSYQGFRSLVMWQKAQGLAVLITKETSGLPHNKVWDAVAPQLLRSAGSVAANVAEGYGRYYEGAFRNHLSIARGSLFETEAWIDLLFQTGCISGELNDRLVASCHEVGRMLTSQMKRLSIRGANRALREEPLDYDVEISSNDA